MRLLVTGAAGMLGHDVIRAAGRSGDTLLLADLPAAGAGSGAGAGSTELLGLDITDLAAIQRLLERLQGQPGGLDAILNCAAWTDVDGAESKPEPARSVNVDGAGNLARAAAQAGVRMLHISTDYVFDGRPPLDTAGRPRPYVETDPTGPRSVYGQTKLAGEHLVLGASPRHTVVRTAWLYGLDGPNFVETMLRLAAQREAVQVVTDQIGSPTWGGHLAPALIGLLAREITGLVHLTGSGRVSWNGFAQEIFRQAELPCRVDPATSEQMARPAPRPAWSALESQRDDILPMPPWQDGLAGYLGARAGMMRS